MSTKEFDDFLSKQQVIPEQEIDWDEQRRAWLDYLNQFYAEVKRFLADYIRSGKVTCMEVDTELFEDFIGKYTAPALRLDVAGHKAQLDPIGTNLIGAKGRVDLEGANGKVRFVLVNENSLAPSVRFEIRTEGKQAGDDAPKEVTREDIKWVWKIATPPPRISYLEFNQESFLQALLEVVDG